MRWKINRYFDFIYYYCKFYQILSRRKFRNKTIRIRIIRRIRINEFLINLTMYDNIII